MRTGSDYEFISIDGEANYEKLKAMYEGLTGRMVRPASPEMLFIQWVTAILVQAYSNVNIAGNQNIPSRAEGPNLDALGELFYAKSRPGSTAATVMMRFRLSEVRGSAVLIPAGTRVSPPERNVAFATDQDVYIPPGETETTIRCVCETVGTGGNGYVPGAINNCVDPFPYYASCENIDESGGGSNAATDEEYYELMVASEDAYSCAGARGAYAYFARSVSTDIGDVLVNAPRAGCVNIYILMKDGTPAGEEIRQKVLEACSEDEVRPLTDHVSVEDPEMVPFDVDITYYISNDAGNSASVIESAVNKAVSDYVSWQCGRIGRDINPSRLIQMVVAAGAKRVEVASPIFIRLRDGEDNTIPQLAQVSQITVTNGGYEDE